MGIDKDQSHLALVLTQMRIWDVPTHGEPNLDGFFYFWVVLIALAMSRCSGLLSRKPDALNGTAQRTCNRYRTNKPAWVMNGWATLQSAWKRNVATRVRDYGLSWGISPTRPVLLPKGISFQYGNN